MDTLTPEQEAASLSTTPERLQELASNSEDENVLRAIAANPNTSPELLLKLGENFPQEMLDNPVFNLLLLENPLDSVIEMPISTILSLLQLEEIPSFLKQGITRHKERIHIANRSTPALILEILAQDTDERVRSGVAYNSNTPVSILKILSQGADYADYEVRAQVARNANTPAPVLEILAQDVDVRVRTRVAERLNTPVSTLEILAQDTDVYIRGQVAINPNTPFSILEILAQDTDGRVRQEAESRVLPIISSL